MAAIAAGLVIAALVVDWRSFGWPDPIGILAGLVGVLLAVVIVPLESKWIISAWLWLEKTFRRKGRKK